MRIIYSVAPNLACVLFECPLKLKNQFQYSFTFVNMVYIVLNI